LAKNQGDLFSYLGIGCLWQAVGKCRRLPSVGGKSMVKHVRRAQEDQVLTLAQRRAFMKLSLKQRRRMLAAQAERMVAYDEQESELREREAWQGGDIGES
jgi:hypothetical protein